MTATRVFIALEDLGISNTSIERVDHSRLEAIRYQMRTRAVENARKRELALVKPLNQTLGAAIHIADNEQYHPANQLQGRLSDVVVTGYGRRLRAEEEPPTIEFEKLQVSTNVGVKFILKQ